jgi:hypothetical protein
MDKLVVEAVSAETVSAVIFPVIREKTGKNRKIGQF